MYLRRYSLGRPKGVLHTQRQVMTNAARAVDACKLTTSDVWFHAAPMFHAMGEERSYRSRDNMKGATVKSILILEKEIALFLCFSTSVSSDWYYSFCGEIK